MDKKFSKLFVGVVCVAGLFLTQCREEPAPPAETPVTTEQSLDIATTPLQPTATSEPTVAVVGTETTTAIPAPTTTPTEGEVVAEAAAQQFVPEYFRNQDECFKAVAEGIVTECMYQSSIQNIVRPEWEELFPDTEFYFIRLDAYHPEDEYGSFSSRNKLVARQNDQQFEATSFDKLLAAYNISVTPQ